MAEAVEVHQPVLVEQQDGFELELRVPRANLNLDNPRIPNPGLVMRPNTTLRDQVEGDLIPWNIGIYPSPRMSVVLVGDSNIPPARFFTNNNFYVKVIRLPGVKRDSLMHRVNIVRENSFPIHTKFDLLFLSVGGNDVAQNKPLDTAVNLIKDAIVLQHDLGCDNFVISTLENRRYNETFAERLYGGEDAERYNHKVHAVNLKLFKHAKANKYVVYGSKRRLLMDNRRLDGVHFVANEQQSIVEEIYRKLTDLKNNTQKYNVIEWKRRFH